MSALGRSWAQGLVGRVSAAPARSDGDQLAGFSDAERQAIVRGQHLPSKRAASRWIHDQSGDGREAEVRFGQEAVRVFARLKELGGSGSVRDVQAGIGGAMGGFVRDGISDLERLGLVSRRPGPRIPGRSESDPMLAVIVLAPGWEDLALSSRWSRAGL